MYRRAAIAILTAISVAQVRGDVSTNATCSASSGWMANAQGQNPCLVSAYLSAVCNNGNWFVPALVPPGPYNPPAGTGVTTCRCNTVIYSLLQACSVCQGGVAGTWSDWISFCPSSYVQKTFPSSVPPQTSVPGWATLDPTTTNLWNATAAQQAASQPSPGPKSGGGTNVGAIVGGVIGGVVGLALIGFGIWYYLQRSSRGKGQKVTPAPYVDPNYTIDQGYNNAGYVEKDTPNRMDMGTPAPMMGMPPMRPYDPADPSTFPPSANPSSASPAPTSTYVGHDMGVQGGPYRDYPEQQYGASGYPPYPGGSPGPVPTGSPGPQMHRPQPGGYTGAAEV